MTLFLRILAATAAAAAAGCVEDLHRCPDGRGVGRDPNNNCQFYACDRLSNDDDTNAILSSMCLEPDQFFVCSTGDIVRRDPKRNCSFEACPTSIPKVPYAQTAQLFVQVAKSDFQIPLQTATSTPAHLLSAAMTHINVLAVLRSLDETQLSIAHSIHALKLSPAPRMLDSVPPRASSSDEKLNSAAHLIRVQ
ncbi:hypothetical protein LEN26_005509 [Aphanomyces euteiches]|nr:hypothetical protein AeMF1_009117 [Aphanomyces euteiches]KAH9137925.1 hypothetical protein LEN26_005509 [Aphanomyces euteiches]KAH9197956.1 hypothetical protein AeNC1_000047 [Aphanomyces euteiches]